MKCDELKPIFIPTRGMTGDTLLGVGYYPSNAVDEAIAELKAENERLVKCCKEYDSRQRIDERIKFNGAKQLRATKRALWLSRVERAKAKAARWYYSTVRYDVKFDIAGRRYGKGIFKSPEEWYKTWINVGRKCRAKAEEYK